MKKERFNELKLKFTDGKGKYIFPVPVIEMQAADLRDYIDYCAERYHRAAYYVDVNGTFKAIGDANSKQQNYVKILHLAATQRPDVELSEEEKQLAGFGA